MSAFVLIKNFVDSLTRYKWGVICKYNY